MLKVTLSEVEAQIKDKKLQKNANVINGDLIFSFKQSNAFRKDILTIFAFIVFVAVAILYKLKQNQQDNHESKLASTIETTASGYGSI